jgi:hypothetical protein
VCSKLNPSKKRYAQSGRLLARKSNGTWLTTRSALQALIVELMTERRGRPREEELAWATFEMTPSLVATLAQIDDLRAKLLAQERSELEEEELRRQLTVEAIQVTNLT